MHLVVAGIYGVSELAELLILNKDVKKLLSGQEKLDKAFKGKFNDLLKRNNQMTQEEIVEDFRNNFVKEQKKSKIEG